MCWTRLLTTRNPNHRAAAKKPKALSRAQHLEHARRADARRLPAASVLMLGLLAASALACSSGSSSNGTGGAANGGAAAGGTGGTSTTGGVGGSNGTAGAGGNGGTATGGAFTISAVNTFFSNSKTTEATWPEFSLEALVRNADNTFTPLQVIPQSDKSYVIANPPSGEVYLKYVQGTTPYFVVTPPRVINLGSFFIGRPDAKPVPMSATLALKATGLRPWEAADDLFYYSPTAGGYGSAEITLANSAREIDSAMVNLRWANMLNNDQLIIMQQGLTSVAGEEQDETNYSTVTALVAESLSLSEGATTTLTGEFRTLEQSETTLAWNAEPFQTSLRADAPSNIPTFALIGVSAQPTLQAPLDNPWGSEMGWISLSTWQTKNYRVQWGNPFPNSWQMAAHLYAVARRMTSVPGSTKSLSLPCGFEQFGTLTDLVSKPIALKLSLPRELKIAGQPTDQNLTGVGQTPEISWSAPTLGNVANYWIQLNQYEVTGDTLKGKRVAHLVTRQAHLRIPPQLLKPGQLYTVTVYAKDTGIIPNPDAAPLSATWQGNQSWVQSTLFSP